MKTPQEEILSRLAGAEKYHGVTILYAAEAGSRAWGFASPDSDYDVRFVYAHPTDRYLLINDRHDVIEYPIIDDFDVSGWDLRKTLQLFWDSNPALYEWLVSPIVYRSYGTLADTLRRLAQEHYSRKALAWHYLRMAEKNFRKYVEGRSAVSLKKYLYVVRPLIMVQWMDERASLPPIELGQAMDGIEIPRTFRQVLGRLLEAKKSAPERGEGGHIPEIDTWVADALVRARCYCDAAPAVWPPVEKLNELLRETLKGAK